MGKHPREIAAALHPTNKDAARRTRRIIEQQIRDDPRIHQKVLDYSKTELLTGIGPTIKAMIRRADKGNVMAAKLILEMAGVHNPRVKHEHKGDIKIKLEGLPRPVFERSGIDSEPVVDAQVVD